MGGRSAPNMASRSQSDDVLSSRSSKSGSMRSTSFRSSSAGSGGGGGKSAPPRRGLEWSLRSLHSIDNSAQHFLDNYYETDDMTDSPSSENFNSIREDLWEDQDDQTAYEIFKAKDDRKTSQKARDTVWASLNAPLRTGIVDGKKVVFELRTAVNERPAVGRAERLSRKHVMVGQDKSSWEVRTRLWLMHFSVSSISAVYLTIFLVLNVVFAVLFFFLADDKCCEDPDMEFGQVFAFTVQTSTTIGYGSMSPTGMVANFLVVVLSFASTLVNTIFAGLLFTKFVTPVINIQFSDVMTLCNVNGVPCLSFRIGNADGALNPLTDINVRLTYSYQIPYSDHNGEQKYFRQTEELKLLSDRQHGLSEVWTLRHVLDENSPLFGLHFEEHPANKIYVFTLSIDAVQNLTKSSVNLQTEYALEDILIGHTFQNQVTVDYHDDNIDSKIVDIVSALDEKKKSKGKKGKKEKNNEGGGVFNQDDDIEKKKSKHKTAKKKSDFHGGNVARITTDFAKMSDVEPYPVWYPARTGAYDTSDRMPAIKSFHA